MSAVDELRELGWIVDHYPDRKNKWFVGLGSHGGSAPTLRKAIKRCLRCCKIGNAFPERKSQALYIMDNYLGGYK
jgi:hypothetical protein